MSRPSHIKWFVEEQGIRLKDNTPVNCYFIDYQDDDAVLDEWALHIRRNYIDDEQLVEDAAVNEMTVEEYLTQYVIPQKEETLGPIARSADIGEIIVSDLLEFVYGFSVPRFKMKNRSGKCNSQQGTDVIGYKYYYADHSKSDKDELIATEVKATLAPLRALCNEITYDLNRSFYNEAIINQISDVLQDDYESKIAVNDKKIIICTPEKLSYIIHHQNDYLDSIDLFVFDEGHMFDDRTRGAAYELLITYVKQHLSYNQQCVCVVCTSTLAQGVNIPIRYLLVNSLRVGQDIIKVREFQNLIGRTARSGIYTEGSIIITDNKLYDNRKIKKNGGYYRWEECKKLIDANSMEPCSSSILSLVQNTKIDYESKFPSKNFIEFVLNDFDNENVFQEYIKYIFDKYKKKYPSKNTDYYYSIIYNEVFFRKSVISQIENYLCTIYSKATSFFEASVALNICRSTLAYTLANDEEKALLERVFIRIEEKILKLSTNKIANYALSMIGIDMSEKIESWINDNQLTDKLFSESELMDLVKCFFIETHTIRKCKDDFLTICDLWVDGKTPFEMHTIADNDMNDIDDVCSKQISYELSFFIGNIRDLLADSTGLFKDELEEELSLMQKKVKYGVPTLTALSICEKVFYDRLLAVKISDVLEDDDISEDEIIISIQQRKEEIMELLNVYPEFFGARINSAIQ